MTPYDLVDCLQCSNGTFAAVTGMRSVNEIEQFRAWLCDHAPEVPRGPNVLATVLNACRAYRKEVPVTAHQKQMP